MDVIGEGAEGEGEEDRCRLGLKMRTMISPKMIRRRRNMHFLRPVFFWYLRICEERSISGSLHTRAKRNLLGCHFELFDGTFEMNGGLLNIILNAIKESPLVYHKRREILEELCERRNRVGNLSQLSVSCSQFC